MASGTGLGPSEGRIELLVAGVVGAGLVATTAFLGSLVVAAMTVAGTIGAGTSLWVLFALLLTVVISGAAAAGATAWLAWLAVEQLRTTAVSGWRRLLWTSYRRTRAFEERSLVGRLFRPTRFFAARGDHEGHLVEELKARYVAGGIDEHTFERELGRLLGGGEDVGRQVRREIEVSATDGGAHPDGSPVTGESAAGDDLDDGRSGDHEDGGDGARRRERGIE